MVRARTRLISKLPSEGRSWQDTSDKRRALLSVNLSQRPISNYLLIDTEDGGTPVWRTLQERHMVHWKKLKKWVFLFLVDAKDKCILARWRLLKTGLSSGDGCWKPKFSRLMKDAEDESILVSCWMLKTILFWTTEWRVAMTGVFVSIDKRGTLWSVNPEGKPVSSYLISEGGSNLVRCWMMIKMPSWPLKNGEDRSLLVH